MLAETAETDAADAALSRERRDVITRSRAVFAFFASLRALREKLVCGCLDRVIV